MHLFSSQIPNFHTHIASEGGLFLLNLLPPFQVPDPQNAFLSAGIHPWYIDKNNLYVHLSRIEFLIREQKIKAIGETGLDTLKGADMKLQTLAFEAHLELAQNFHLPIVIHCVKSFSQILDLFKKHNFKEPVIFHGFRSRWQIANPLLERGFYLSFGPAVLSPTIQLIETLQKTPLANLLIETDDSPVSIKEIFSAIISHKKISGDSFAQHLNQKFKTFFY